MLLSYASMRGRQILVPNTTSRSIPKRNSYISVQAYNYTPATSKYIARGPFSFSELSPIVLNVGEGSREPLTAQVQVYLPKVSGGARVPVSLLSPGFLLPASLYRSTAAHLASWGYAAITYDLSELVDDVACMRCIREILDCCESDARLSGRLDVGCTALIGHSRGGKLSCLTAAVDGRVSALALLDPVDNAAMTPTGPGYPSALPRLHAASRAPRSLPVLVVGAAQNGDVITPDANYKRFCDACVGPLWDLELTGAGHLQFLDSQPPLMALFSSPGITADATVRSITQAAVVAWLEGVLRPPCSGVTVQPLALYNTLSTEAEALRKLAPLNSRFSQLDRVAEVQLSRLREAGRSARSGGIQPPPSTSGPSRGPHSDRPPADRTSQGFSGQGTAGTEPSASGGGRVANGPVPSYEELNRMRARDIKALLQAKNIPCNDLFEKSELINRLLKANS